jgi:G3E family GTPase
MAGSAVVPVTVLAGAGDMELGTAGVPALRAAPPVAGGVFRAERLVPRPGCLCCSLSGDLVRALRELHAARLERRIARFERVVVRADVGQDLRPILAALAELPLVAARFAPGGIVAVVESAAQLEQEGARAQVAMADRVVLRSPAWREAVRALNPGAMVDTLAHSLPAGWLETGSYRGSPPRLTAPQLGPGGAYRTLGAAHEDGIAASVWRSAEPFALEDLESALETLVDAFGARLLRMKGLVHVRGEGPRAVHAVGHTLYPSARLAAWPDDERTSRIVFIGQGLEERPIASILNSFRRTT